MIRIKITQTVPIPNTLFRNLIFIDVSQFKYPWAEYVKRRDYQEYCPG